MIDIEGNKYQTIKIGNQEWMAENLKVTKYNDGLNIPLVEDNDKWTNIKTPAYCWYNNDIANKEKYGALYNWYTVNTKKLAPIGWHIPTNEEWDALQNYLILNKYNSSRTIKKNKIAKSLASKTDWRSSTIPGTIGNDLTKNNRSGFSALPGGSRHYDGPFSIQNVYGFWWSATENGAAYAWNRNLFYDFYNFFRSNNYLKSFGFSVRLVMDLN
jgi:uncharacterized protein (TIGR02145 family)